MKNKGFTLIELMVAILLLTFITILAWRSIDFWRSNQDYILNNDKDKLVILKNLLDSDMDKVYAHYIFYALSVTPDSIIMVQRDKQDVKLVAWKHRGLKLSRWEKDISNSQMAMSTEEISKAKTWIESSVLNQNESVQVFYNISSFSIQVYREDFANPFSVVSDNFAKSESPRALKIQLIKDQKSNTWLYYNQYANHVFRKTKP